MYTSTNNMDITAEIIAYAIGLVSGCILPKLIELINKEKDNSHE